jgi:hypothetical protein
MSEWFITGLQWSQTFMLFIAGYFLADSVRVVKRSNKIIEKQLDLMNEMLQRIHFQQGVIYALQAGVIGPWNLPDVDLRNLPIELRIKIWHALIDVAMELHNAHEGQAGSRADQSRSA